MIIILLYVVFVVFVGPVLNPNKMLDYVLVYFKCQVYTAPDTHAKSGVAFI